MVSSKQIIETPQPIFDTRDKISLSSDENFFKINMEFVIG